MACRYGGEALVERLVEGREVTVGILGDEVLGSCEVESPRGSLRLRRASTGRRALPPAAAAVAPRGVANVEALALAAYRALGCRGYGRVDLHLLRASRATRCVLEVNTLPGLTPVSLLPKIAQQAGLGFGDLLERILALATRDEAEVCPPPFPALRAPLRRAAP